LPANAGIFERNDDMAPIHAFALIRPLAMGQGAL
jgi:hypothetical protein